MTIEPSPEQGAHRQASPRTAEFAAATHAPTGQEQFSLALDEVLSARVALAAADTRGRRLLAELAFGPTIVNIIHSAADLLGADWSSVCLWDAPSMTMQQVLAGPEAHACVQLPHFAPGTSPHPIASETVLQRRGACAVCRLVRQVEWCASVALVADGENLGTLCVMRQSTTAPFGPEQLHTLQVFADWAAVALANAQKMRAAQETEYATRRKIAAHLHDNAAQALNVIGLQLDQLEAALDTAGLQPPGQLDTIRATSRRLLEQVRAAFGELHAAPAAGDLVTALADCIDEFRRTSSLPTELVVVGSCVLPPEQQVQVLHIVREALANVRRHARAGRVAVKLVGDKRSLHLSIQDDGIGFDVHATGTDHRHLGMTLMRERAQRSGGYLDVYSRPGQGTEVILSYLLSA